MKDPIKIREIGNGVEWLCFCRKCNDPIHVLGNKQKPDWAIFCRTCQRELTFSINASPEAKTLINSIIKRIKAGNMTNGSLKKLRKALRYSKADWAQILDISRMHLHRLEKHPRKTKLRKSTIDRVLKAVSENVT